MRKTTSQPLARREEKEREGREAGLTSVNVMETFTGVPFGLERETKIFETITPSLPASLLLSHSSLFFLDDHITQYGSTPSSYSRNHLERCSSLHFPTFLQHRTRLFDS
jgi:hypothetical protein